MTFPDLRYAALLRAYYALEPRGGLYRPTREDYTRHGLLLAAKKAATAVRA